MAKEPTTLKSIIDRGHELLYHHGGSEQMSTEDELYEAKEIIADLVAQNCVREDGKLDSKGISVYSVAMNFLHKHKIVWIESGNDRRVLAIWLTPKYWEKT